MDDRHPILGVAEAYITEACPLVAPCLCSELVQVIAHLVRGIISAQRASEIFLDKVGTATPVQRIVKILSVPDNPIHSGFTGRSQDFEGLRSRRRQRPWTEYEDQRLLCGIIRFGLESWTAVSQFVGNQRTRAQCAQRWFRGLDPRISRVMWTSDEERKLVELAEKHHRRSWKSIAMALGNRSDAQCRYHYLQMVKGGLCPDSEAPREAAKDPAPKKITGDQHNSSELTRRGLVLPPITLLIENSLCDPRWTDRGL
jgi:hypothetical protein